MFNFSTVFLALFMHALAHTVDVYTYICINENFYHKCSPPPPPAPAGACGWVGGGLID